MKKTISFIYRLYQKPNQIFCSKYPITLSFHHVFWLFMILAFGKNSAAAQTCTLLLNDDSTPSAIVLFSAPPVPEIFIRFSDLLTNDQISKDISNITITHVVGCGTGSSVLNVQTESSGFRVSGSQHGIWTFCYDVSGTCSLTGATLSAQATVTVTVLMEPIPLDCDDPNDCNLICYGDFQDFMVGTVNYANNYYNQIGVPPVNNTLTMPGVGTQPNTENTPDIFYSLDNNSNRKFLDLQNLYWPVDPPGAQLIPPGRAEHAVLPLSEPIYPGCTVLISFKSKFVESFTNPSFPHPTTGNIFVFGLDTYNTNNPFNLTTAVPLNGIPLPITPTINAYSMNPPSGPVVTTLDPDAIFGVQGLTSNIEFDQESSYSWTNTSTSNINYLLIYPFISATLYHNTGTLIDDLHITQTCNTSLAVTPQPNQAIVCSGGTTTLEWEACGTSIPGGSQVAKVSIDLDGLTAVDPTELQQTLTITEGQCVTISIEVIIPTGFGVANATLTTSMPSVCYVTSSPNQLNYAECCACAGSNSYEIGVGSAQVNLTASGLPQNIVSNACISVHNILVIDDNFAFSNCEIIMQPGAKIVVNENRFLSIKGGQIHGCPNQPMWRTIEMMPYSKIYMDGVQVEDAQHAVTLNRRVIATFLNNKFYNNYIGLYTPAGQNNDLSNGATNFTCLNNKFSSNGLLLHPAFDPSISFSNGAQSYAGILFNNVQKAINIGTYNQGNSFSDLGNGIILNSTTAGVYGGGFKNIALTYNHPLPTGYGIRSTGSGGSNLIVQPKDLGDYGYPTDPNFDNCRFAIVAEKTGLTALNNKIRGSFISIQASKTPLVPDLNISDNWIETNLFGIDVFQGEASKTFRIMRNHIRVNEFLIGPLDKGIAIRVDEQAIPHLDAAINNNIVKIYSRNQGIILNNVNKLTLQNNIIELRNGDKNLIGINITNGQNLTVRCNTISGNDYTVGTEYSNIGLYINNTSDSEYGSTTHSNVRTATLFENACLGTDYKANQFADSHKFGIKINTSADLNDQKDKGNIFSSMLLPDLGAQKPDFLLTKFIVHSLTLPYTPQYTQPVADFFIINGSSGTPFLPSSGYCTFSGLLPPGPPRELNDADIRVITNSLSGSEAQQASVQKQLYRTAASGLFTGDHSGLAGFMEEHQTDIIGYQHQLSASLTTALHPNSSDANQIQIWANAMEDGLNALRTTDDALPAQPTLAQLEAHWAAKSNNLTTLNNTWSNWDTYANTYKEQLKETANLLNTGLETINAVSDWAINDKQLYTMELQTSGFQQTLTTEQAAMLLSIANQCPEHGGDAVYRARSLYRGEVDIFADFSSIDCNEERAAKEPIGLTAQKSASILRVSPNPTADNCTIALDAPVTFKGYVQIHDYLGRLVAQYPVQEHSSLQVSFASSQQGLYLLTLRNTDGVLLDQQTISITR
jgi:hypothetical protein